MNHYLQSILDIVQQSGSLSNGKKETIKKAAKAVDNELTITEFKLERTEKVKRTTAILLEETIEELEQKRKAVEEQNRELEIETALERIRAQATAMQESTDLLDIVVTMHAEFTALGHEAHYFWHMRWLPDTYEKAMTSGDGSRIGMVMELPRHIHGDISLLDEWEKSGDPTVVYAMDADAAVDYVDKMISLGDFKQVDPNAPTVEDIRAIGGLTFIMARTTHGEIGYSLPGVVENPPAAALDTLVRFAGVFDLAYKRFEDLKAAERQHREAQIELALERVRARTMAMQHSDELIETSELMFEQIKNLDIELWSCGFSLWYDDDTYFMGYNPGPDGKMGAPLRIPLTEDIFFTTVRDAKRRGDEFLVFESEGKSLEETYRYMDTLPVVGETMRGFVKAGYPLPKYQLTHCGFFSNGHLMFITQEHNPEAIDIFKRFTKVFNQTYTRFLDLQKAEEQTREAQIEASLEKVRNVALSLKKSDDMLDVAQALYEQLLVLGFIDMRNAIIDIHDDKTETFLDYDYSEEMGGTVTRMSYYDDSFIEEQVRKIESSSDAFFELMLEGKKLQDLIDMRIKNGEEEDPRLRKTDQLTYNLYSFGDGAIGISNFGVLNDGRKEVLKRFRNVFTFAYKRYTDLARAEAQAREALKQSTLDRVRAQITSMRGASDLEQIIPLIWKELTNLGVSFIRCGLFIMDEENELINTYLSTPDGQAITSFKLPCEGIPLAENVLKFWRREEIYHEEWSEKYFVQWTQNLINDGYIDSKANYSAGSVPKHLSLHFIPFEQGSLYIGNTEALSDEDLELAQTLANTFSTAYARYEDFRKLEEAKAKIEQAYGELEAAKDQLVQQEKLASLGQLTAGIAHEIKNPLNFVNNFSEVGVELIEEAREEITEINSKFDIQNLELSNLLDDIEANLRKIHEHGSRADSIVKSMLQHSRGGSGKMEPEDFNALVKEYVNLAFHGMRAGKDPINVDIELDLDENVGEVPLIAEDFSRVIVNLCNNAFDAMKDKLSAFSARQPEYQPKLIVRTGRGSNQLIVEIEDNGPGIPEEIKDKILQPFFTTKKGTEGTGLGLSITNDIVKAHGGSLEVSTAQNEGTRFTINL